MSELAPCACGNASEATSRVPLFFGPFLDDGIPRCPACQRVRKVHAFRGFVTLIALAIAAVGALQGHYLALLFAPLAALAAFAVSAPMLRDGLAERGPLAGASQETKSSPARVRVASGATNESVSTDAVHEVEEEEEEQASRATHVDRAR